MAEFGLEGAAESGDEAAGCAAASKKGSPVRTRYNNKKGSVFIVLRKDDKRARWLPNNQQFPYPGKGKCSLYGLLH